MKITPACDLKAGSNPKKTMRNSALALSLCLIATSLSAQEALIPFGPAGHGLKRVVIDSDLPGGYQVEMADVNGDQKLDIVALGGGTVAWYENPSWTRRIVSDKKTSPGVISTATKDIDGDGKAEIAIAYEFEMNNPKLGKLMMARQKGDGWVYEQMGPFPSIHRLRWGDFDGDGQADLAIAPIFGQQATGPNFQQEGAKLEVLFGGKLSGRSEVSRRMVTHAIGVIAGQEMGRNAVLSASNEGVWQHGFTNKKWEHSQITVGAGGDRPKTGASEIHLGKFADGRRFYATIEPWHGSDVVIQPERIKGSNQLGPRFVIDTTLKEAHALCVADIDGDGTDEVFAGYRGPGTSVNAYRFESGMWTRTVIDSRIAAQDLRSGDINGDGLVDVVSVGGSTKNVVLYLSVGK